MSLPDLHIAAIQSVLHWENPDANKRLFANRLRELKQQQPNTDLVLLPEMFSTGFSMKPERLSETEDGPTVQWMREQALLHDITLTGSLIIREHNNYFNRLYWLQPDGSFVHYDKRHLFRMGHEDKHYAPGMEKKIVLLKGWKICPLICYDLRFPVWSRNQWSTTEKGNLHADYDLLLYIANWPEARRYAWEQLLKARAIENQCYVAGLNRVGVDGNNNPHCGNSVILNYLGEEMRTLPDHQEGILTANLSYADLEDFRKRFPVGLDADAFELNP